MSVFVSYKLVIYFRRGSFFVFDRYKQKHTERYASSMLPLCNNSAVIAVVLFLAIYQKQAKAQKGL